MSLRSKEWDPQTKKGKSGTPTRVRVPKRVATEKLLSGVYVVLLEVTFKATDWWLSQKGVLASKQSETLSDHAPPVHSGCWSCAIVADHVLVTRFIMCHFSSGIGSGTHLQAPMKWLITGCTESATFWGPAPAAYHVTAPALSMSQTIRYCPCHSEQVIQFLRDPHIRTYREYCNSTYLTWSL